MQPLPPLPRLQPPRSLTPALLPPLPCSYLVVEFWRMIQAPGGRVGNYSIASTTDEPLYDLYVTASKGTMPRVQVNSSSAGSTSPDRPFYQPPSKEQAGPGAQQLLTYVDSYAWQYSRPYHRLFLPLDSLSGSTNDDTWCAAWLLGSV